MKIFNKQKLYEVKWQRSKKLGIVKDDTDMYIVNFFKRLLKNTLCDSKSVSVENVDSNNIEEDNSTSKHNHYPDVSNNDKIGCIFNVLVELRSQLEIVTANYQYISKLKNENSRLRRNLEK